MTAQESGPACAFPKGLITSDAQDESHSLHSRDLSWVGKVEQTENMFLSAFLSCLIPLFCVSEAYLQLFPYEPLLFCVIATSFPVAELLFGLSFCSASVWVVDPTKASAEDILLPVPSLMLQLAAQQLKITEHLH